VENASDPPRNLVPDDALRSAASDRLTANFVHLEGEWLARPTLQEWRYALLDVQFHIPSRWIPDVMLGI